MSSRTCRRRFGCENRCRYSREEAIRSYSNQSFKAQDSVDPHSPAAKALKCCVTPSARWCCFPSSSRPPPRQRKGSSRRARDTGKFVAPVLGLDLTVAHSEGEAKRDDFRHCLHSLKVAGILLIPGRRLYRRQI